ncbi:MAG: hypothetical protein A2X49_12085 [Lentisphaerae bacterium GWF2_52_8]|nr:MAG: hypothetical protein A2X49_12085 [Lentisphaerae bacterium GWF2_52_8]
MSAKFGFSRLAVVCGGTGGHFFPGLSVARTFKESGGEAKLFLSGRHAEAQAAIAKKHGLDAVLIPSSQKPRNPLKAWPFLRDLALGTWRARKAIRDFRPEAMLAMGSFASVPSAFAALSMKVPIFLHEGNARLGKANIFLSRFARHLGMAFPPVNSKSCRCPWSYTGMPVRPELMEKELGKADACVVLSQTQGISFSPQKPLLLIFGGSQGAETFNKNIPAGLKMLASPELQVIHLSGAGHASAVRELYKEAPFNVLVLEKFDEMGLLYSAADLVFCRAGGSTLAELALFGRPAILVPYPYAADGHQDDNAAFHASSESAELLANRECSAEQVSSLIGSWLAEPEIWREKGAKARRLAKPHAALEMLSIIECHTRPGL